MANLIEGKFSNDPIAKISGSGEFLRASSSFRGKILPEQAEKGRFHLYVSYACPWAHRTLIVRNIKKLQSIVSYSVTDPYMGEKGWTFSNGVDPRYLAVVYLSTDKQYTGKITVPVLWDKKAKGIVNNESSEIIRIFNESFDDLTDSDIDLYPAPLRGEIDTINKKVYANVNNGVYRAGFAGTQRAYEEAFRQLFSTLDEIEERLSKQHFLAGDYFTEADVRLFTTLLRFDPVYYGHFKCNLRRIKDYHSLYNYLKCLYQMPEIKETCHLDHIKEHYYKSHKWINPIQIVPLGPEMDLDSSHDRGAIGYYRSQH